MQLGRSVKKLIRSFQARPDSPEKPQPIPSIPPPSTPPAPPLTAQRIVFTGEKQVQLEDFSLPAPEAGEVRVQLEISLMSTGTENIVLNRQFDEGTHWTDWVKYPFYPGYAAVGTVEALGTGVSGLALGMRVACRCKHQSHAKLREDRCYPLPDGLPWEEAVWFALAKIGFRAVHAGEVRDGDSVLIIGAGPVGQMALRWARVAGARSIITVDRNESRLPQAREGGATAALCLPAQDACEPVLAANGGQRPRVVIDATANPVTLASALRLAEDFGTVVLVGTTGRPSQQALTDDLVRRGLRLIGAHDCHDTDEWNDRTITHLFFQHATEGRFPLRGLETHAFPPANCAEAYATANRERSKTLGILFRWT